MIVRYKTENEQIILNRPRSNINKYDLHRLPGLSWLFLFLSSSLEVLSSFVPNYSLNMIGMIGAWNKVSLPNHEFNTYILTNKRSCRFLASTFNWIGLKAKPDSISMTYQCMPRGETIDNSPQPSDMSDRLVDDRAMKDLRSKYGLWFSRWSLRPDSVPSVIIEGKVHQIAANARLFLQHRKLSANGAAFLVFVISTIGSVLFPLPDLAARFQGS